MQIQITRISPLQTAKVVSAFCFVMTIPFLVLAALTSMFSPGSPRIGIVLIVFAPLIYALFGFVFAITGAWIYNVIVKLVGGIEYTATATETRDF